MVNLKSGRLISFILVLSLLVTILLPYTPLIANAEETVSAVTSALSRKGWTATASSSNSGDSPSYALDGFSSRWTTGKAQTNGQWFQVDMKTVKTVETLVLDTAASANDYPRSYQVYFSKDGKIWSTVAASGSGKSVTTISIPRRSARYVKILQTGSAATWWSIHELNIYGSESAATVTASATPALTPAPTASAIPALAPAPTASAIPALAPAPTASAIPALAPAPTTGTVKISAVSTISGSIAEYTGSIPSGSKTLTLTGSHDFRIGHGIAIKTAGTYMDGWLRTTITAVNGNTLTLAAAAGSTASSAKVHHDESIALQNVISSLPGGSTLVFDVAAMNVEGVKLSGNITYDGNGCIIRTPLYANQPSPNNIYKIFSLTNVSNIVFKNFVHDGGKQRGVNGNDQFGTSFVISQNVSKISYLNNTGYENLYVEYRNLDTQTDISYIGNNIKNTDVAICFMAAWQSTTRINNLLIENNVIDAVDCNSEAIAIIPATYNWKNFSTGAQLAELNNVIIRGNTINKPGRVALIYGGSIGRNILIENNKFIQSMFAISSYDGYIELLDANGQRVPEQNSSDGAIIRNNDFGDTYYEQLRLSGRNITLDGNKFGNALNAGSLIVGQDRVGTTGVFEVKNSSFSLSWKSILQVLDSNNLLSNLYFHNNSITAANGTTAIDLRYGSNVRVIDNQNAANLNCRVPMNSVVTVSNWASIVN